MHMKKSPYLFLFLSTILYALPFFFSAQLWWLIFIFPIPLLHTACTYVVSFKEGYIWGIIVFALHLHAGICIIANLAGDWWWIGFLIGITMVLYQAIMPAFLFGSAHMIITCNSITSPIVRLVVWATTVGLFIVWVDQYCMWIFGIQEGYPLMHPLIVLAQHPALLLPLSVLGKPIMLIFFLLIPISVILFLWYKNICSLLFFVIAIAPWMYWGLQHNNNDQKKNVHTTLKSLPLMIRAHNSPDTIRILIRHLNKLITAHPETTIVVMPESALDMIDPQDLCLLNQHLQKKIHLIFGACHCTNDCYYNALYWVHDGVIKARFDKKHAMLMTERLSDWMNVSCMRAMYFKNNIFIRRADNKRILLPIMHDNIFIPYICSELFFTEYPDNDDNTTPIMAIVNDTLLTGTYLQELIYLLARLKAIQWQREIVYVSYGRSVFIERWGRIEEL